MVSECTLEVQGYNLDSFGHVNNAVYLNYMETGRWKFLKDNDILDYLMERELYLVVIETSIRYIRELTLFEKFKVVSTWKLDGNYIIADQVIYKDNGKKSASATVKMLLVSKERLVFDVPERVKQVIVG